MTNKHLKLHKKCEKENCDGFADISFSEPAQDLTTEWKCEQCGRVNTVNFSAKNFKRAQLEQEIVELKE